MGSDIACAFDLLGKYKEAEQMHRQALELKEKKKKDVLYAGRSKAL